MIAGLAEHLTIIPPAYQCALPFGSNFGVTNVAFWAIANNAEIGFAEYDSWLTGGTEAIPPGAMGSVGFSFDEWTSSSGLSIDNGAWFYMDPTAAPGRDTSTSWMVAQLSIPTVRTEHKPPPPPELAWHSEA